MKIPSTYLYDLVKALTKSEKRYIKVQAGTGERDYIQLMDALLAQKGFDEEQLIKDNEGANFLKHLAVNKRYLYNTLLKSLTQFGKNTLENKIFEKINAVQVLIDKGLFKAAFSELKKGRAVTEKYEFYELQILLNGLEKKLLAQKQFKKEEAVADKIFEAEQYCLAQLKNTNEYWYLTQQLVQFQTQFQKINNSNQKERIAIIVQSKQFQNENLATNFKSKLYFYQANAIYQFMLGNASEAYAINRQLLDLMEAKPHFLKLYSLRYLATLNNMLIDSLVIGKYDVLNEELNRLEMVAKRPEFQSIKNIESRVFRQRYLILINFSISQKDFSKALKWIPEIEEGLERFGKKIEKHHRITFYYLIAYLLFQNGQYERALHWNNLIMNESKEDVVKEIFYFARILNLLIHYELGNFTLLASLLLSTPKYLKNRRPLYATEKTLFRFLGSLLSSVDKKAKRKLIANFKNEIEELFKQPGEKRVFNYLDLRLWEPTGG